MHILLCIRRQKKLFAKLLLSFLWQKNHHVAHTHLITISFSTTKCNLCKNDPFLFENINSNNNSQWDRNQATYILMEIHWFSSKSVMRYIFAKKSSRVIQGCNSIEKLSHWAICQLTKMYVNLAKIGLSPSLIKVSVMNVLECSMFV